MMKVVMIDINISTNLDTSFTVDNTDPDNCDNDCGNLFFLLDDVGLFLLFDNFIADCKIDCDFRLDADIAVDCPLSLFIIGVVNN